ncbi:MAG: aminodeoxychorismate synthase component I [Pseudomonadota bacterium]
MDHPFVLLDDCNATPESPKSRLYLDFVREHVVDQPQQLEQVWADVNAAVQGGLHAAFLIDYEWGSKLLGVPDPRAAVQDGACLRILLFRRLRRLSSREVDEHLQALEGRAEAAPAGVGHIQASVTPGEYAERIGEVLDYIRAGETYQVNFTYRLAGKAFGNPVSLYRRLRLRQPVEFGALVRMPAGARAQWVLSCSPELFVAHAGGALTARPMKGTAPRADDPAQDQANADWLANDPKNRAENVMIVDLLRNDLGRISEVGSVRVPKLFSVESYRTVHQMTSTVLSTLPATTSFPQILRALFPCGSITGAPKHHTMELIARLESTPRGLYTGAMGWIDAPAAGRSCGDFCMSVTIRTLTLGAEADGTRPASLGVGGGIVIDSTSGSEFDEALLKARFLTGLDPGFTLFETLRCRGPAVPGLERHLVRLAASARALGFRFDREACRRAVLAEAERLGAGLHRLRLDLRHDGTPLVRGAAVAPLSTAAVKVLLAEECLPAHERALVVHKTSLRSTYDKGIASAEASGAFDTVFFNGRGELTEGGRSNVFVRLDGRWWTPPVDCGLLPGTMRGRLLSRSSLCGERAITRRDLVRAEGLLVCNALRGALPAQLAHA